MVLVFVVDVVSVVVEVVIVVFVLALVEVVVVVFVLVLVEIVVLVFVLMLVEVVVVVFVSLVIEVVKVVSVFVVVVVFVAPADGVEEEGGQLIPNLPTTRQILETNLSWLAVVIVEVIVVSITVSIVALLRPGKYSAWINSFPVPFSEAG